MTTCLQNYIRRIAIKTRIITLVIEIIATGNFLITDNSMYNNTSRYSKRNSCIQKHNLACNNVNNSNNTQSSIMMVKYIKISPGSFCPVYGGHKWKNCFYSYRPETSCSPNSPSRGDSHN